MIDGVQDVYYNVRDMKRAVAFYKEALGLQPTTEDPHWTALTCGPIRIGLHWTEGSPVPAVPRDAHGSHAGGTLTLRSTDVPADRMQLEKSGAKILGEFDEPWGHLLVFEDPDGNVLKLMKPKY